jgi:hypothetical protein
MLWIGRDTQKLERQCARPNAAAVPAEILFQSATGFADTTRE